MSHYNPLTTLFLLCQSFLLSLKMSRNAIPLLFCKPCVSFLGSCLFVRITEFQITLITASQSSLKLFWLYVNSTTATAFSAILFCQVVGNRLAALPKDHNYFSPMYAYSWSILFQKKIFLLITLSSSESHQTFLLLTNFHKLANFFLFFFPLSLAVV